MSIKGPGNQWAGVIDDQASKLLKLVAAAGKRIQLGAPDEKEDDITMRLCLALQRSRTARRLMFYVHPQSVELDPDTGEEFGRMDIAFYPTNQPWVPREDIYFCLECKRLNVIKDGKPRGYWSEYVTLGMMRFVTGQYSRAVRHGAMIGYVRDGNVTSAMSRVEENIRSRHQELAMKAPGGFVTSGLLVGTPTAKETNHHRARDKYVFRLHHLFIASGGKRTRKKRITQRSKDKKAS
jgi:hypothetical protein